MAFLSHIFLSLILVVQGFFGYAQPPAAVTATTTVASTVTSPQASTPTTTTPTVIQQSTPAPVTPTTPPNSTLCNGIYYAKCADGSALICPNSGAAYCAPSPPTQQAAQQTNSLPSNIVSPSDTPLLTITFGQAELTYFSTSTLSAGAYITWDTNMPTDSKVFFTLTGQVEKIQPYCLTIVPISLIGPPKIFPSGTGNSTHHYVNIGNLAINYQYTYEIEAIAGLQDQKISKTIYTNSSKFALCPTN